MPLRFHISTQNRVHTSLIAGPLGPKKTQHIGIDPERNLTFGSRHKDRPLPERLIQFG